MSLDITNSILIVIGCVALYVYRSAKRAEKRNAAIIVVMDILHAEQVVLSILENGMVDKTLKAILAENNWAKYKHLFASEFSHDDFTAFDRFFNAGVEIADARKHMGEVFYANLTAKATLVQQKIFAIENLTLPEGQKKKQQVINEINNENFIFDPQEPKVRIFQCLQMMGRLSNTTAFENLSRVAGIKV